MRINTILLFALAICSLTFFGCGPAGPDYGSLDFSEVHGTITLDGRPLSGGTVHFESEAGSEEEGDPDTRRRQVGRVPVQYNVKYPL